MQGELHSFNNSAPGMSPYIRTKFRKITKILNLEHYHDVEM